MASLHQFHERAGAVPDMAGPNLCRARAYAFCPLAVSLDSMVKIAS